MDIGALLTLKQSWSKFCSNHPRFPDFLRAVKDRGIMEGTEIKISVTYPDGQTMNAGLKLKRSDLDLLNTVSSVMK